MSIKAAQDLNVMNQNVHADEFGHTYQHITENNILKSIEETDTSCSVHSTHIASHNIT